MYIYSLPKFPADTANTISFNSECAVNHALNQHVSEGIHRGEGALVETHPLDAFKAHLQLASADNVLHWPLCYGYLSVADPFFKPPTGQGQKAVPAPQLRALLFQFFDDLTLCSPADIDDAGVMRAQILSALSVIHAARVLHRDLEERTLWSEVGFRNLFVRDRKPVILDFDHSQLVRDEDKDRARLAEEKTQMEELMAKALENKGRERGWALSREARRLM
ncbi:hypothetical protein C8R44DRAFT_175888 [Mycena epipterygia]|nr:hypothetical protein C8R44DRAFT_175888 [Mycena epipterygia]